MDVHLGGGSVKLMELFSKSQRKTGCVCLLLLSWEILF